MTDQDPYQGAIDAALGVMAAHIDALNARDEAALAKTLHFPHHRLAADEMTTWETPDSYFGDFRKRAGDDWSHSRWDDIQVIAAGPRKVHLDVRFTRFRADGTPLGHYRSLWVISEIGCTWGAKLRSSFAGA